MYFYIRGLENMSKVSMSAILDMVVDQVSQCWKLAIQDSLEYEKGAGEDLKKRENLVNG